MDKALSYIALARKAGRIELGEEPVGMAAQTCKANLILVAEDAGSHTWRRAQSFAAIGDIPCVRVPFTKDQMGQATGRASLALAAFTDPALALAFVKALDSTHEAVAALEIAVRQSRPVKTLKRSKRKGSSGPKVK